MILYIPDDLMVAVHKALEIQSESAAMGQAATDALNIIDEQWVGD